MLQMKYTMKFGRSNVFYLIFIILFSICITSCSTKSELYAQTSREENMMGYDSYSIEFEVDDNSYISNTFYNNDYLFVCVQNYETDTVTGASNNYNTIYRLALSTGDTMSTQIYGENYVCLFHDNIFYSLTSNSITKFDAITGELISTINISSRSFISNIIGADDGYFILGDNYIEKYDYSDNMLFSMESDELSTDIECFFC